jgi:hypothetical protein
MLWSCDPGGALDLSTNGGQDTSVVDLPYISYSNWPYSVEKDSTVELEVLLLDSATRSEPLADTRLVISVKDAGAGDIANTSGETTGSFTTTQDGIAVFRFTPSLEGQQVIVVSVLDSAGDQMYSGERGIFVTLTETPVEAGVLREVPFVSYINWPASAVLDSAIELDIILLDSATRSKALSNIEINVSLLPSSYGVIADTSGLKTGRFVTSDEGTVRFQFIPTQLGHPEIGVVVLDSIGTVVLSQYRPLSVTEDPVEDNVTKLMSLEVLNPIINADGTSKSTLKVTVKDELNHPLRDVEVKFSATGGIVVESAQTDDEGEALGWIKSERRNKTVYVTATVTSHGQNLSETQSVVFSGIQLSVIPGQPVVEVNKPDTITVSLKDAGGREITNDTVVLKISDGLTFEDGDEDSLKVLTDSYGQFRTWVSSDEAGQTVIRAIALGAQASAVIGFTNNTLSISKDKASLPGDGSSTVTLTARLKDGSNRAIEGARMKWNTSFGSFVQSPITSTDASGESSIEMLSPEGSGTSIVSVEASIEDGIIASGRTSIEITALRPHRLEVSVSPDNIKVNVGETTLRVHAFDDKGNILNGLLVGFKMVKSAGGGDETIVTPTAYTENGSASTVFRAGSVISSYQGVKFTVVALDVDGNDTTILASSDTVSLTISGPPAFVSVGANIDKGINPEDGTYSLPIAAVVSDINGNLVADGTKVNFSLVPSGYYPNYNDAYMWWGPVDILGMSIYRTFEIYGDNFGDYLDYVVIERPLVAYLPWTDYNNNGVLDEDEEGIGGRPQRGEDLNGNGVIEVPPERYYDLNGNLRRETGTCPDASVPDAQKTSAQWKACDFAEPFLGYRLVSIVQGDTLVYQNEPVFVDYNGDGYWDKEEFYIDENGNGFCDCYGSTDTAGNYLYYEFNFEGGPTAGDPPLPYGKGGGVTDVVETFEGKAVQVITYPQTDAVRIQVRITAESNGVKDYINIRLPIILNE